MDKCNRINKGLNKNRINLFKEQTSTNTTQLNRYN